MSAKVWSAALLGALVAAGLAGSADAAAKRMRNQQVYVCGRVSCWHIRVSCWHVLYRTR